MINSKRMVARRGNAPRSAGCGPAALLLSYLAIERCGRCKWGNQRAALIMWKRHPAACRRTQEAFSLFQSFCELAERQGFEPWTPLLVRLFSRQRPRPAGRAPLLFVKWLPDVDSHHDEPCNRRSCYFTLSRIWRSRQELHLRSSG